jgi:hypothetical protein
MAGSTARSLAACVRVLAFQRLRQVDGANPGCQIVLVPQPDRAEVEAHWSDAALRYDGDAVLLALTVSDEDFAMVEVHVLDAQANAL